MALKRTTVYSNYRRKLTTFYLIPNTRQNTKGFAHFGERDTLN